jgi:uncharacterized protein
VIIVLIVLAVALGIYAPGLWAQYVLNRFNQKEYFSGNGYDLARLMLADAGLSHIAVEETALGDHYDPSATKVRLNPRYCGRKSLTAVVVAAHEVGHAIQDASGYAPLKARTKMVLFARTVERAGVAVIMAAPLVTALLRVPVPGVVMFLGGLAGLGTPLIVHLITLPVEWDASFGRAIPHLIKGRYLPPQEEAHARTVLTACALTYVAGSLAGLLNVWRWVRILRR